MKRIFSVFVTMFLFFTCCIGTSLASSELEPYASLTLSSYSAEMISTGTGTADVDFSVNSSRVADKIGADVIRIYKLNGECVKTVYGSVKNGLVYENDTFHNTSYDVSLSSGSYYAKVTVFATLGSITDSKTITTSTVRVS